MTGTGTQNDPYIVSSWSELTSVSSSSNYVKLGADIDMDTEHPEEVTSLLAYAELDGQDHNINGIKCAVTNNYNSFTIGSLKNIEFSNISVYGNNYLFRVDNAYKVKISGIIRNVAVFRDYGIWERCAFTLQGNNSTLEVASGCNVAFKYCSIKLSGTWSETKGELNNSRIFGTGTISTLNVSAKDNLLHSYVNIAINSISGTDRKILINTSLINCPLPSGYVGATTEQLKSASYLESIGFPIANDETSEVQNE